jgi:DNA-binding MarR family transcriptional regulator
MISVTALVDDIDTAALKLRTVLRLLIRRAYGASGPDGPTRSEQGVMAWLDQDGPLSPSALAAAEKVRPQTIGQTLDSLEARGWIKRTPHSEDRRQVLISLSPAGRAALRRVRALRQSWLTDQITQLEPQDRKTLIAALEILDRMAQS